MKEIRKFFIYFCLIIGCTVAIIPILWTLLSSIKTDDLIWKMPPVWIFKPTLSHWISVTNPSISDIPRLTLNSLIIGGSATLISLILGIPAAFALSVFHFKTKRFILFWTLTTKMAPPFSIAIPMFLLWNRFGLIDTHIGLILMYIAFDLGFIIWLMKNNFDEIPADLLESAQLDGCSLLKSMMIIAVPLVKSGIATSAFITFIFNWNEFLIGVIFTREVAKTIQVGLTSFVGFNLIRWGALGAAALVAAVPAIILGLFMQRFIVTGLTLGAVKE